MRPGGRSLLDQLPNCRHGFVTGSRACISVQVHLNIGGLAVLALRGAAGERIAPEVLHVLHVLVVVFQQPNQAVVVSVRVVAELLLALQQDHGQRAGVGFLEVLAEALHRLERRRPNGTQRHRVLGLDLLQRGTPMVISTATASQPKIMGTDKR